MIFYDEQRAWHLNADVTRLPAGFRRSPTNVVAAGREYPLHVVTHEREVWLPAGEPLPVGEGKPPRVFAMPYADGQQSFTAIALPVLLRRMPGMDDEKSFATFSIGVAGHELVHTRQLADVLRRAALNMLKGNTEWVQEEGFVLFVLIDRLVPNWQARFFGPDFPSAFAVLREAVRR